MLNQGRLFICNFSTDSKNLILQSPAIIGNYVGTTLLVALFEENSVKDIEMAVRRFEQSGVIVKGCILNGVVKKGLTL